ncbi:MAG: DUF983 domain-containing protein [Opitutales bacterium]
MRPSGIEPFPPVNQRQILSRGLRGSCPNCGQAALFRSLLRPRHTCPVCGMTIERGNGYFLGPLCINYGIVAFLFITPVLIAGFAEWIPLKAALVTGLLGALFLPVFLYRPSWSIWLTIYYLCLPDELHANRPENSDDLSFEEDQRAP